jgi:hypothetical protein
MFECKLCHKSFIARDLQKAKCNKKRERRERKLKKDNVRVREGVKDRKIEGELNTVRHTDRKRKRERARKKEIKNKGIKREKERKKERELERKKVRKKERKKEREI